MLQPQSCLWMTGEAPVEIWLQPEVPNKKCLTEPFPNSWSWGCVNIIKFAILRYPTLHNRCPSYYFPDNSSKESLQSWCLNNASITPSHRILQVVQTKFLPNYICLIINLEVSMSGLCKINFILHLRKLTLSLNNLPKFPQLVSSRSWIQMHVFQSNPYCCRLQGIFSTTARQR